MRKREDLNNNTSDFKQLSDEVSDLENKSNQLSANKIQQLDKEDHQQNNNNEPDDDDNLQGTSAQQKQQKRSGSLAQQSEMAQMLGQHFQATVTPSESGGYNSFKPTAFRQKINDNKIDNGSDENYTREFKSASNNENALGNNANIFSNQNQILQSHEEMTIKQHLELQAGQPLRSLRNLAGQTNKLIRHRYRMNALGIGYFLWDTLVTFEIGVLIFHIILAVISQRNDECWNIIICVGVINILGQASINIFQDQRFKIEADSVNKQRCEKFVFSRRQKRFKSKNWDDLQVGDIIRVFNNQELPADSLILDIKNSASVEPTCYVKGSPSALKGETQQKKPCQNTQNKTGSRQSDSKFVQQLSGQVRWECTCKSSYSGSFKLNENPAAFEFNSTHVVERGSFLYLTEQIICMVINVGDNCLGSVMGDREQNTQNPLTRILKFKDIRYVKYYYGDIVHNVRLLQAVVILISFLSWIFVVFSNFGSSQSSLYGFQTTIMNFNRNSTQGEVFQDTIRGFTELQTQYMLFFPYLMKIVLDCVIIFHNLFIIWDVNLVPSYVNITNYFSLSRLSQISHMVLSPSTLLGVRENVAIFRAGHQSYQNLNVKLNGRLSDLILNKQNEKAVVQPLNQAAVAGLQGAQPVSQNDQESSDESSRFSDDEPVNELDYLPISKVRHIKFENQQVQNILEGKESLEKKMIDQLLQACVLCHQSILKSKNLQQNRGAQKSHHKYKSIYDHDDAQLYFANSYKYSFSNRKNSTITIMCQGKQEKFEELVITNIELKGNQMTIQVLRPYGSQDAGCRILFKSNLKTIAPYIREEYQQILDSDLNKMTRDGMHAVTFAKRELDFEEAADLYRVLGELQTLHKGNKQKTQEILLMQCEDLDLIGTIGIKPSLNRRNSMFMEEVHRNGIKIWLLSSKSEWQNLVQVNSAEFLSSCTQPLNVKGQTERKVEESLKQCLKQVSDRLLQQSQEKDKTQQQAQSTTNRNSIGKSNRKSKKSSGSRSKDPKATLNQNGPLEVVFTNGYALSVILKDESMLKFFLILCSLCNCVVGSQITVMQKISIIKALKEFNLQGNMGYVLSIVSQSSDRYLANHSDVTIGIKQKFRSSDSLAITDMTVTELHSLTYIMFKHATQLHRRLFCVVKFFLHRTVLLATILTIFILISGLSYTLPFQQYFTTFFTHIFTPFQYFLYGISQKDYGYDQFHRIFGEYRNNQYLNFFGGVQIGTILLKAIFDGVLCCFFAILCVITPSAQVLPQTGFVTSAETLTVLTTILVSMAQLKLMRDNDGQIIFFQPIYIMMFLLSCLFILQDDNLIGVINVFTSPATLLELIFILLLIYLQEPIYKFMRMMLPTQFRESLRFYKNVEEMLFMEEYEDSDQEFTLQHNSNASQKLLKQIKSRELLTINQNMRRVHRSDSMDQILERINMSGENLQGTSDNKIVNRSTLINKYSLKLTDFNKELEYQSQPVELKVLESIAYTLYVYIAIVSIHILYNITTGYQGVGSDKIAIFIVEATMLAISIILVVLIKKLHDFNHQRSLLLYVVAINILANLQQKFSMQDLRGDESDIIFFSTLLCTLCIRLNSFFSVAVVLVGSTIAYCAITQNSLIYNKALEFQTDDLSQFQVYWLKVESFYRFANVLLFLVILLLYSYWDETTKKISFVINYRKQKEFQKQKHILNILVPSIVRARIQEGQKNFSDAQGEVTIVFCDIEGFDELVQLYEGKELIELLDQTYNAFDQLCDQYGLQKIETVGKTYMACGGLKIVENKIDQRLLGNHYSVRVVDYAFEMQNFVNQVQLKNGQKMRVKIGIHTGDVISGVVGETKPQFSLIGDTVNKSSRVCSKCPHNKVLISKETLKFLEIYSNNFSFEPIEVFMKGIGTEKVYKVTKRKMGSRMTKDKIRGTPGGLQGTIRSKSTSPIRAQSQSQVKNSQNQPINSKDSKTRADKKLAKSQLLNGTNDGSNINAIDGENQYQEAQQTNRSNDSQADRRSDQKSNSDGEGDVIKAFGQQRDDRQIVKNPTLNIRYKLVERPRFLLQFNLKEQEQEFQQFISKFYVWETICFLSIKTLYDSVLFFTVGWRCVESLLVIQLSWVVPFAILSIVLIRYLVVSLPNKTNVVFYSIVMVVSYFVASMLILLAQEVFDRVTPQVFKTVKYQIHTYALLLFALRPFQTRQLAISAFFIFSTYVITVFLDSKVVEMQYIFETIDYFLIISILVMNGYFREMGQRKQYNNERIIDVEIEKTEDLLSKLVPYHILAGIKNDQRIVDVLDNVTLLYTDMVGFTAFSNSVKNPIEVVQLLSKLFSKFDQLTDMHGVYKVHTIGDCYVVMGYTGRTPKYRRTTAVQIEEAYRVVKVGLDMIDIIREVRESSQDPNLKSLDMRIGIHTGRIVGGIIGTKVVRYDIFGQDVLIANKMESNGKQGSVCISENTLDLLKQNQFIMDTLDFTQHQAVEIGNIGRKIQSYLVEQIFMQDSINSDSNYSSQDGGSENESSGSDESQVASQNDSVNLEGEVRQEEAKINNE